MSGKSPFSELSLEVLARLEALTQQALAGTLSREESTELENLLKASHTAREAYFLLLDVDFGLRKLGQEHDEKSLLAPPTNAPNSTRPPQKSSILTTTLAIALCVSMALLVASPWLLPGSMSPTADTAQQLSKICLKESARGKFFGENLAMVPGTLLTKDHDYALIDGSILVKSPKGAEVIFRSPAIFSIVDDEQISLKVGQCSVHAPDGAEGFQIVTPRAEIVDHGTRFSVAVEESGDAEIEVLEGAAQVASRMSTKNASNSAIMLTAGQRTKVDANGVAQKLPARSPSHSVTTSLPDRVVDFSASGPESKTPDRLTSLAIQRDSVIRHYQPKVLIPGKVDYFRAGENKANLVTPQVETESKDWPSPDERRSVQTDWLLNSGFINPGGAASPLKSDPILAPNGDTPTTPGFAIRFDRPVVNHPGPDIVLFDLHVVVHPEHGDSFHVAPLHFAPGLKSHTITQYDISLSDHAAHPLSAFTLYRFRDAPQNLDQLLHAEHDGGLAHVVPAKVIAVGIDLSDLGYPVGAKVERLFFQDALDDAHYIDPVLIVGLPPLP